MGRDAQWHRFEDDLRFRQVLHIEQPLEDPLVQGGLTHLVAIQDRPQSDPSVSEELVQPSIGEFGIDDTLGTGDTGRPQAAKTTLTRSHAEPEMTTQIVHAGLRVRMQRVGEHRTAHQLAFADDLIVTTVGLPIMQAVGDLIGLAGRRSGHGLIGGAALKPADFVEIINAANQD